MPGILTNLLRSPIGNLVVPRRISATIVVDNRNFRYKRFIHSSLGQISDRLRIVIPPLAHLDIADRGLARRLLGRERHGSQSASHELSQARMAGAARVAGRCRRAVRVGLVPMAWFWHRTLAALGQPAPWRATLRAYFLGHLGKYVPGKAMAVILRVAAVRKWVPSMRIALIEHGAWKRSR